MSATIEDLKARCIWLSDSLIEKRTLENKFNVLAEQFKKINISSAQDLGNTVTQLNNKIIVLEGHLNQYITTTEQQRQIINKTEEKLN